MTLVDFETSTSCRESYVRKIFCAGYEAQVEVTLKDGKVDLVIIKNGLDELIRYPIKETDKEEDILSFLFHLGLELQELPESLNICKSRGA